MRKLVVVVLSLVIQSLVIASAAEEKTAPNLKQSLDNTSLEALLNIETDLKTTMGNRGNSVDLLKTNVPVDVVTAEQINHSGYTELSKVLQRFIPGFNFPRPANDDGTDHIRPFTLRGMAPDQVLVLINGKRVHSSSLLHVNGTIGRGSTGVDLNTIPLRSIERVEVLRGGAAAQYGSDAIAGIINIILKTGSEEHRLTTTMGQTYSGDGALYQTDIHYGISLPLDGFVNATAEFRDRSRTNHALIDGRQQYFDDDVRNNDPIHQNNRFGDPDTQDFLFALNSELPLSDDIIIYLHATMDYRKSEAGAFFRRPADNRNVRGIYPNGFLPIIAPEMMNYTTTTGIKGEIDNGLKWDLSHTVGGNQLDYYVKNSLNTSLGTKSPRTFDSGGLSSRQHTTTLDLFKNINLGLKKPIKLAGGFEWRYENFAINAGEASSYIQGDVPILDGPNAGNSASSGAQGFGGFREENVLDRDRHNFATYLDLGIELADKWSLNLSGRYEYFSDFGSSLNGKFSLGYQIHDHLLLRSSVSTGFRAPSLQQSYFNHTSTLTNLNGSLNRAEILGVNSSVAKELGASSLEAEESEHFTLGFIYQPTVNFSLSADYFYTKIKNRIIFSRNISSSTSIDNDILALIPSRFFSNAIDTETQGVDLRANYHLDLQENGDLKFTVGYHYNNNKIIGDVRSPAILGKEGAGIFLSDRDKERLELGQPNDNLILMAHYKQGNFDGVVKLIKAGAFSDQKERPDSQWLTDIDLAYQIHSNFNVAIGVHNLFNTDPERNSEDGEFPRSAPYGYNGGFYYARLAADF
ncbi:MAG: TonB-dependent receptor [Methylococcales bacterium]|nr:TonB-dependent receptor [Methylococcales bacterium]